MICVFLTFSFLGQRDIAEFGIGLAAAVALDAFLLRTILVPALMHIFGNANWWLPRWLDRHLPHLAIEPPARKPAPPAPDPRGNQELTERADWPPSPVFRIRSGLGLDR
jgi:RND superfamily putative drug exporter